LACQAGAGVIVMDDGFQNPSLAKDLSLLVIDAGQGVGNGLVFPAGPLRAPLEPQLARTDVLIVVGQGSGAAAVAGRAGERGIPVLHGQLKPDDQALRAEVGKVLAFAGIGDPDKFFHTLAAARLEVSVTRSFADHHRYTAREADQLIEDAERLGLSLLTTEKDLARMSGDPALARLAACARAVPVTLAMAEEDGFREIVLSAIHKREGQTRGRAG
jgi:tetraacyldisaccharide 4'-kinase